MLPFIISFLAGYSVGLTFFYFKLYKKAKHQQRILLEKQILIDEYITAAEWLNDLLEEDKKGLVESNKELVLLNSDLKELHSRIEDKYFL